MNDEDASDPPLTLVDGDELLVQYSGAMPEFLRDKSLPDLPVDISRLDADLIVLSSSRDDWRLTLQDLAGMTEEAKRDLLMYYYRELGVKPLIIEDHS